MSQQVSPPEDDVPPCGTLLRVRRSASRPSPGSSTRGWRLPAARATCAAGYPRSRLRPNAGARILRRSDHRTATIGLLLEDVANPFSAAIQRAVENVALPRGVFVLSASLDEDAEREQALAKQFGARHVDGLVLAPPGTTSRTWRPSCVRARRSCAWTARRATCRSTRCSPPTPSGPPRACAISRRPVTAASPTWATDAPSHRDPAVRGLREALAAQGIPVARPWSCTTSATPRARTAPSPPSCPAPDPPTALFTAQNMITIGAVRALRRLGPNTGWRSSASTTSCWPSCSRPASPWSRRTQRPWAGSPPSCSSSASAAAPDPRGAAGGHDPDPPRFGRTPP